jgi:hypothetical protein
MLQKVEMEDFSGGVTDYYLNAPGNKMRRADNVLLSQYATMGKPFTRFGSRIYLDTAPQIPSGSQRIAMTFFYEDILFMQSSTHLYFEDGTGWTEVLGPTGNNAFIGASTSTQFNYTHWNHHTLIANDDRSLVQKMIIDETGTPQIFQAGLPAVNMASVVLTPGAGANVWLYKFVYRQAYTVIGDVIFADYGPESVPFTVTGTTTVAITGLPVLSNGSATNYRTSDILIDIYRTVNAGATYYLVGSVTNGTTTFNDTVSDATLITRTRLYTTGGVVSNDPPPKCLAVHVSKDSVAYYVNIEDSTGQIMTNRCLLSVPGDIDSVPGSFFVDANDTIVGVSSTKSNTILLCKNSVYRLDGIYDELGRGGAAAERISDTAGCLNGQCAVQALDGVFWLGNDGVYFTDGFQVIRLNQDYDKTYRSWVTASGRIDTTRTRRYQGKYDSTKNRIWWTIQQAGIDVDSCYVLDLNWGVRGFATFTTASGNSFAPTAIEFINGNMIRCDRRGYVFEHQDGLYSDPLIDISLSPDEWSEETIMFDIESISYNFGTSAIRKYVTAMNITCESSTNLSLALQSNNDDSRIVADLLPIRYRGNVTWGDPDIYWGDPSLEWNRQGLISAKRRMPARSLRCNYKSIRLRNAKVAILNSDQIGNVNVDAVAKTATLVASGTFDWPSNAVDYYISFQSDGYVAEYLITERAADVLTYSDLGDTSVSLPDQKWVLRGYPKGEVLNLLNFSIVYEISGPTLDTYKNADSGEVG